MLLTTLTVAGTTLAGAVLALLIAGKRSILKKSVLRYGVGTGSGNVQGDGNHIHYHQQEQVLQSLLQEASLLKEQNAHLRRQNKRLTKQNSCLLNQLETKTRMIDGYHAQLLRQAESRHGIPLLHVAAKAL